MLKNVTPVELESKDFSKVMGPGSGVAETLAALLVYVVGLCLRTSLMYDVCVTA